MGLPRECQRPSEARPPAPLKAALPVEACLLRAMRQTFTRRSRNQSCRARSAPAPRPRRSRADSRGRRPPSGMLLVSSHCRAGSGPSKMALAQATTLARRSARSLSAAVRVAFGFSRRAAVRGGMSSCATSVAVGTSREWASEVSAEPGSPFKVTSMSSESLRGMRFSPSRRAASCSVFGRTRRSSRKA